MSIKEALQRRETERVGRIPQTDLTGEARLLRVAADRRLLDKAKVPALLDELMEVIKSEFPDVEKMTVISPEDASLSIVWNRRDEILSGATPEMVPICWVNKITIMPDSQASELAIEGYETEILTRKQWGNHGVLEGAIVRAYRNPSHVVDIPTTTMVPH
ncbi:MAG: hypothetical protein HYW62_00475 [Candidatus Levybacteria bacterium]|nr:hypothetical protein [Candidatus Levybacteria bacterium]